MPFTIPEIYIGSVVSGEVVLENAQIQQHSTPMDLPAFLPEEFLNLAPERTPQRTTLALGEESTPVLNQRTTKMIGEEATP